MRFKYYLRGCGLGILLTAVILTISFHRNGTKEMSDAQIMQRASELGMVMQDSGADGTEDGQQTTEAGTEVTDPAVDSGASKNNTSGKKDSEKSSSEKNDPGTNDSEKNDSEKDSSGKNNSEKNNSEKNNTEKDSSAKDHSENAGSDDTAPEKIVFTIKRGEYCRAIAENLYDLGLVDDAEAFRKYMMDHDYDNMIQVGSFELTTGMDYEDIAKVIINKDNRI